LHEADHGIVDRRITVRVVLAHDVADDARALREVAVRAVTAVEHRVEEAAVNGLASVADLLPCATDGAASRVIRVVPLHRTVETNPFDPADFCSAIVLVGQCALFPCGLTVAGWSQPGAEIGQFKECGFDRSRSTAEAGPPWGWDQMSRKRTSFAFSWMKRRRESTSSPIRTMKISSATIASSRETCLSRRWSGSIVVSHSSS